MKRLLCLLVFLSGCCPTPEDIRARELSQAIRQREMAKLVPLADCKGKVVESINLVGTKTTILFTDGTKVTILSVKYAPLVNRDP